MVGMPVNGLIVAWMVVQTAWDVAIFIQVTNKKDK